MKDGSGKKHSRVRARKLREAKYQLWAVKQPPKKRRRATEKPERTLADTVS